ncbi:MAG: transcriptional repressor [Alphaproteobacteria bacterium]|nr:transcriptional repressor [Alphaproteobacteria bacterium]
MIGGDVSDQVDIFNILENRIFHEAGHDHGKCRAGALSRAEEVCKARGVRLTPIRKRVLELVWRSHKPVGAYDILEWLRDDLHKAQPPTVYRALEFLREHGLIHRIESLNAFVGCDAAGSSHAGQFLICRCCGRAAELHDTRIVRAVGAAAHAAGFTIETPTIELTGLCSDCAGTGECSHD